MALLPAVVIAEPDWVTKAVSAAEKITFDTDHGAIILHQSAKVKINADGSAKRKERVVIKLTGPVSGDNNFCSEYTNPRREVKSMKGWRVEPDGRTHKLDSKNVIQVGYQMTPGYYNDQYTLLASFPEAGIGDVLAFEYTVKEKKGLEGFFQGFLFQSEAPVAYSRFEINPPKDWTLIISEQNLEPITYTKKEGVHIWESGYIRGYPDEPFMPVSGELKRYLRINCVDPRRASSNPFIDWKSVSDWFWQLQDTASDSNHDLISIATEITSGLESPLEKLRAVASFVQGDVRYVAVEFGIGRYKPRDATLTLFNRYGDCKDKVTLLRSMLKVVGISSFPALALVDGNVDIDFPSPFQFNHVILAVPVSDIPSMPESTRACKEGWLYFDPTDESTPVGQLPMGLHGTTVLRASKTSHELVTLPRLDPNRNRREYHATVRLMQDGSIAAQVRIVDFGVAATKTNHRRKQSTDKDQIKKARQLFSATMVNPLLTDYSIATNGDSAWQTFSLSSAQYVSSAGQLRMLKLDIFHPDQKDRLKKKERRSPVWFGHPMIVTTDIDWTLPDTWVVSELPDTVHSRCETAEILAYTVLQDSLLKFHSLLTLSGEMISPENHDQARKFEHQLNKTKGSRVFISQTED